MKLSLALVSCLLLAAGCKTDSDEPAASSSTTAKETSGDTGGRRGRSGKIDFERPRTPMRSPSLPDQPGADEDRAERRRAREERWEGRRLRMEERRKERMAELDTDGDGNLSPEELAVARQKRAEDMRGRFDTDGDGKLSPAELGEARMFRRGQGDPAALDTDKNGEISAQELEAGMSSMRNRFRRSWDDATGSGGAGAGEGERRRRGGRGRGSAE